MEYPKVAKVEAKNDLNLVVKWIDSKASSRLDLTGLVARSRHFRVFSTDKNAFRKVRVADYGSGIEWENGLDLSAESLKTMADEQRAMSGKEFVNTLAMLEINTAEAAHILDLSERTVRTYGNAEVIPRTAAVTIRRCVEDPNVFAALYRPIPVAPRGRPKSSEAQN